MVNPTVARPMISKRTPEDDDRNRQQCDMNRNAYKKNKRQIKKILTNRKQTVEVERNGTTPTKQTYKRQLFEATLISLGSSITFEKHCIVKVH